MEGDNLAQNEHTELKRGLKPGHCEMIAIGGTVGVGMFLGSANTIRLAGPCLLLGYILVCIVMYIVLRSLGEVAVKNPISGSFSAYAGKYIGPLTGYLIGWNYWFFLVLAIMADITAVGTYMKVWFPDVPTWIWALASLALFTLINLVSVDAFGRFEFWFVLIKVLTIVAFIIIGLAFILIAFLKGDSEIGFSNLWTNGGFFPNGALEFFKVLGPVATVFLGIEALGLTAGEIENPEKNFPLVINRVSFKVCIFYVGAITITMSLFAWNKIGTDVSPFVLVFEKVGLKSAAGILNFIIVTAALSACSSMVFSSGRMAYTLETAPKFLKKLSSKQIPVNAILFSSFFGLVGVVLLYFFPKGAFDMIIGTVSVAGLFVWIAILITQIRFRKTLSQDEIKNLKYRSILFPFANYICIAFIIFVIAVLALAPDYRIAVFVFPAWIAVLTITYFLQKGLKSSS